MKPGRELDTKVAEEVMGGAEALPYSTNVVVAWQVDKPGWLWEFQEMPDALTVTLYTSFTLRREAIEMYPVLPKDVVLVRERWLDDKAGTYAWLRCLAALEAVGVEVENA